ncbi:hypothetical protein L226DRAFT_522805 [Lentinus tigrinus ALCF2SS1-7]|uniref:uncharacterized protein n=1 Tax=Lentinus tigrinus ALCF2SS1-7 TaxID=1328758 RepID=UPI0011662265|nr:hypothetical protein L226DRAFT_522805 [Lentinus tigrinus ALCF2SS1-7]
MAKWKALNATGSDDDVADSPRQDCDDNDEVQQRCPDWAAKTRASIAWDELKPRSRILKRTEKDRHSARPEDDDREPGSVKKTPAKSLKAGTLRSQPPTPISVMYSAPDINLNTDEERSKSNGESKGKKKGKKKQEVSANKKHHKDKEQDPPQPAPRVLSKRSKPDTVESDSSESSDDEHQPKDDVDEEESSGKSNLEELEKDDKVLDRVFRDEPVDAQRLNIVHELLNLAPADDREDVWRLVHDSPAWADGFDNDAVAPSPHPAPSTSDDETDDNSARITHAKPQPEKTSKPKKRAKVLASSDESEKSDGVVPPPPKKHKHIPQLDQGHDALQPKSNTDKGQRGTSATSDGRSRSVAPSSRSGGHSGSAKSKAVARETARPEKVKAKGEHNGTKANSSSLPHAKRKGTKFNENVEWADGSNADENTDTRAKTTKRSRVRKAHEDSAMSSVDSDSDGDGSSIDIVPPLKGHLKLTDQHHHVKRLVQAAIHKVLIIVCTQNAFPEGTGKSINYARRALITAAKSFNDKDMVRRLKSDDKVYWQKLASMVTQRLSNLRSEVKKMTNSNPSSLYNLKKGDAAHVAWLLEGLRYIYPNDYALYASIDDYRQLPFTSKNFTVNANLEAYQRNIQELADLKAKKVTAYHWLMHGFYVQICWGAALGSYQFPQHRQHG